MSKLTKTIALEIAKKIAKGATTIEAVSAQYDNVKDGVFVSMKRTYSLIDMVNAEIAEIAAYEERKQLVESALKAVGREKIEEALKGQGWFNPAFQSHIDRVIEDFEFYFSDTESVLRGILNAKSEQAEEIDFSYDVEFNISPINGSEAVETLLKNSFPSAKFIRHEWDGVNFSEWLLMIDESGLKIRINIGSGWYEDVAIDKLKSLIAEQAETVSYIAKPSDSRCAWWSVQLPADIELNSSKIPAPYLRKGADLELKTGDMLVTSEARHHRKNRGYDVFLSVCVDGEVKTIFPLAQRKAFIKNNGGKDLMHESGDVAGCVRMAVWLRRQPDLSIAFNQLLTA